MRRMHFGAIKLETDRTAFSIWAPQATQVDVVLNDAILRMEREESGVWRAEGVANVGTEYCYKIDNDMLIPDPASRAQAKDVHGPSGVTDLDIDWQHGNGRGCPLV